MSQELLNYTEQLKNNAFGMLNELKKAVENNYKNMSKEDAETMKKMMDDTEVIKMANERTESIINFNKQKHK